MKKFLVILFLIFVGSVNAQQKANYALAERFRELTTMPIIKYSLDIHPYYVNNTDRFWYSFGTEEGNKYYLVDPEKRTKNLLFDNAELLAKISEITRRAYDPKLLNLHFEFDPDGETIRFGMDGRNFTYNVYTKELQVEGRRTGTSYAPYWMYYSADSAYMLYAKHHNLYAVGNSDKGKDTTEIQLTNDGEKYYSFNREDEGEMEGRFGCEARWLKKGHRFYAIREDARKVDSGQFPPIGSGGAGFRRRQWPVLHPRSRLAALRPNPSPDSAPQMVRLRC